MTAPARISRSRIIVPAAACAITIIIVILAIESQIDKIKTRVDQLTLNAKNIASLQLQRECSEQAMKVFKTEDELPDPSKYGAAFTNHYNPSVSKCFMIVSFEDYTEVTSKNRYTDSLDLSDAFEGRDIGMYVESYMTDLHRMNVITCRIALPNGTDTRCKSKAEWQALAKNYME